jgi:hypothetical protein
MRYFRPLLATTALALLTACSGQVNYDYDARAHFSAYQTYAWQISPQGSYGAFHNDIVSGRVQRAVEAELGTKGYRLQVDSANPDFLVNYYPLREADRSHQVHLGLGFGMGPLGVGVAAPVGDPQREAVAGIVLEIQDFQTRSVVWKATAEGALQGSDSPEEANSNVRDAVHNMLKKFPPGK